MRSSLEIVSIFLVFVLFLWFSQSSLIILQHLRLKSEDSRRFKPQILHHKIKIKGLKKLPKIKPKAAKSSRNLLKNSDKHVWKNHFTWQNCAKPVCKKSFRNGTFMYNIHPIGDNKEIPDCAELLQYILSSLDDAMTEYGYSYYISFGTLLGSVHRGQVFPWTSDVDITLKQSELDQMLNDWEFNQILFQKGLVLFRGGMRLARVCFDQRLIEITELKKFQFLNSKNTHLIRRQLSYFENFVYGDLYMEYLVSEYEIPDAEKRKRFLKINPSDCLFDSAYVYPLKRCAIGSRYYPCPKNSTYVLSKHYGSGWNSSRDDLRTEEVDKFGCAA